MTAPRLLHLANVTDGHWLGFEFALAINDTLQC